MNIEEIRELIELKTILISSELSRCGKKKLFKLVEKLESQLDIANKKLEKIKEYNERNKR